MSPLRNQPAVSPARAAYNKRNRINPIRQLQPENLARQLDAFHYGDLKAAALLWDAIERRDDILVSVIPKRKKAVARRTWEILTMDDSPEAEAQKETLENFYNNLRVTEAVDQNVKGGVSTLIKQMMDAVGKKYAVHNLVWSQGPDGLTCKAIFTPLWFFENRKGVLQFLESDNAIDGVELQPGEWMVTVGEGLMEASSIAYTFKKLPMQDWLIYSDRHGMPGIQGKTRASKDSDEWLAMEDAVANFAAEYACVTSDDESIEKIDLSANGELPYPKLVERMDRVLSAMWRGADLSTMSAGDGQGQGASVQGDETELIEMDDCAMITETLNEQIDRVVLKIVHGTDTPLAYFNVSRPQSTDTKEELEVDKFLVENGAPLGKADTLERYGRAMPEEGEELLSGKTTPAPVPEPPLGNEQPTTNNQQPTTDNRQPTTDNQQPTTNNRQLKTPSTAVQAAEDVHGDLLATARLQLTEAQQSVLLPVAEALGDLILQADRDDVSEQMFANLLQDFMDSRLPLLLAEINADPETERVLYETMSAATVNGAAETEATA